MCMAEKIDLKKTLPSYRARQGSFEVIEVPAHTYLMIDGAGDPNTEAFAEAVSALYPAAYGLKFLNNRTLDRESSSLSAPESLRVVFPRVADT